VAAGHDITLARSLDILINPIESSRAAGVKDSASRVLRGTGGEIRVRPADLAAPAS
jgi:hypothetical protein